MRLDQGTDASQASSTLKLVATPPSSSDCLTAIRPWSFALEYTSHGRDAETALTEFDPSSGTHLDGDNEPTETTYRAPYRFLITDRQPTQSLTERYEDHTLCRLPFWRYLLIC